MTTAGTGLERWVLAPRNAGTGPEWWVLAPRNVDFMMLPWV